MRVLDVSESYSESGGGVRTYVHDKLRAAAALGVNMTIVAPGTDAAPAGKVEIHPGGRIVRVASRSSPFDARYGLFSDERTVHALIDEVRPDVIEGSSPWNGGRFVASYRGTGRKSFVFHTDPIAVWPQTFLGRYFGFDRVDRLCTPWWNKLRTLTNAYDTTVVSGEWLARRLANFGIRRTTVVPFGIDKDRFSPGRRDPALRAELLRACGLDSDAALLVAISRLDPEKQVSTILDGFARAATRQPMGLVVFGRGALRWWFERKAQRIPGVHLYGYASDREFVARALASADAFVHGSAAETYGLVVAESICSGVPVVVPDRGGAAALANGRCGQLYRAADPKACAEAIAATLKKDRAQLTAACEASANQITTTREHFEELFGLYSKMRSGRRAADARRRLSPG